MRLTHATSSVVEIPQTPIKVATSSLPDEPIMAVALQQTDAPPETMTLEETIHYATLNKNTDLLAVYLPQYEQMTDADPIAVAYARAVLAVKRGDTRQGIAIYRQILSDNPELSPIRFELAQALYDDKQTTASKDQFIKLMSDNPPPFVQEVSSAYLRAIVKRSRPQVDFSLNYLKEDNINNANNTPNIANSPFVKSDSMYPKSATGLSYGLSLSQDVNVKDNHYVMTGADLYGKYYHDAKDYNDTTTRIQLGYGYQDGRKRLAVLPFYEKRWYANDPYQHGRGWRLEYSNWITPKWQISTATEYARQRYDDNTELNGRMMMASVSAFYLQNAKRYMYAGVDFIDDKTTQKHYASTTQRLRFGVGQEWSHGISGRLGLSVGRREFKDTAVIGGVIPLDIVRQDTEYGVTATLWKRDWHWLGITPKLSHSYKKVDSNIPSVYSYDRHQTYLLFEKTF